MSEAPAPEYHASRETENKNEAQAPESGEHGRKLVVTGTIDHTPESPKAVATVPHSTHDPPRTPVETIDRTAESPKAVATVPHSTHDPPRTPVKASDTKRVLVLDLDGTLVYSKGDCHGTTLPTIKTSHGLLVCKRPFVDQFLQAVSLRYSLVVWTAADEDYASQMVEFLFHGKHGVPESPDLVLDSSHCDIEWKGSRRVYKDLKIVAEIMKESLGNVLVVDDTPSTYSLNPDSALPIPSFHFTHPRSPRFLRDDALQLLTIYLTEVLPTHDGDVREFDKRAWRDRARDVDVPSDLL